MNIERLLTTSRAIVPGKIKSAGGKPEELTPTDIEKVSFQAIMEAIPSALPDAVATLVGGQKFPDITIELHNEVEGVEVKSTRNASNPWSVTGGSIMEGNRIETVNEVWVMFTRLAGIVETRTRLYADAVCDLAVTHSPRYILDMESPREESLFAKLKVSYEDVRKSDAPFDFFRKYLADKAKAGGGHPWWTDTENEVIAPPLIRFWGDLEGEEQMRLLVEAYALFAGDLLFGSPKIKYNSFAMHLVRNHSVICKNIRDPFSAGGRRLVKGGAMAPAVFRRFSDMLPDIKAAVLFLNPNQPKAWIDWKEKLIELAPLKDHALLKRIFKEKP